MRRIYKKIRTYYVRPDGKRCLKGDAGARKSTKKEKVWRGRYKDASGTVQDVQLSPNKQAAEQMLNDILKRVEEEKAGIISPFRESATRPLEEHVQDYQDSFLATGRTQGHCRTIASRIRRIIDVCSFKKIVDVTSSPIERWLGEQKKGKMSDQTARHYVQAIKQFTRWLVADHRFSEDRLKHLQIDRGKRVKQESERRELSSDELTTLLEYTVSAPVRSLLSGEDRCLLYATAVATALRASELASLTPESFSLDSSEPTVTVAPEDEKARRGCTVDLPHYFATILQGWLANKPSGRPLWPGKWASQKRAGRILKADMAGSRKAWLAECDVESDEYRVRSGSDFLLDWISNGKVNFKVDFHALRHTGISRLNRAGVSAKILQLFARHSSVELTLGRYTHANQKDMAIAVNSSPEITIPKLLQHRQASVVAHDKSLGAALGAASGDFNGDSVRSIEEKRPFPRASA